MRCNHSGFLRVTVALLLSLLIAGLPVFERAALSAASDVQDRNQIDSLAEGAKISSLVAIASKDGVLIRWSTSFELGNVGFNVYRETEGQRTRINREIVPGSVFIAGEKVPLRAGYSYSIFDRKGTPHSVYSVESIALDGTTTNFVSVAPKRVDHLPFEAQLVESTSSESTQSSVQVQFPTVRTTPTTAQGQIEDQWEIASQPGLKISISKDGWYRLTRQQMVAAGFSPTVDISNLRLFNEARELAILTNRPGGQFVDGDYIEFYGEDHKTPTTGSNTYYLLAGNTGGKRIPTAGKKVRGAVRSEGGTSITGQPQVSVLPTTEFNPTTWFWWLPSSRSTAITVTSPPIQETAVKSLDERFTSISVVDPKGKLTSEKEGTAKSAAPKEAPEETRLKAEEPVHANTPIIPVAAKSVSKRSRKSRKKKSIQVQRKSAHAVLSAPGDELSFDSTVELKERFVYFSSLLNGDTENFFGAVLSGPPVDQKLVTQNPIAGTGEIAHVEIALQGASSVTHTVNVEFNGAPLGTLSFFGFEHKVQTLDVASSQLRSGTCAQNQNNCNTVRLTPAAGAGLSIVDYIRITYPHTFHADVRADVPGDTGSLRFSMGPSESATIDGFTAPGIRLIDYTDPFAVRVTHPAVLSDSSGYSLRVPSEIGLARSRNLLALSESSADQPAALSLNQPSTLNLASSGADLVIIAYGPLMSALAPLKTLRSQQMAVSVVDIEDVYDEFGYGDHGPQAIKAFLQWASTHWSITPKYVIFAGDASYDPRNYLGYGARDFVPTKLVDATFNETASDDWLTDFNNDGIADIPVGRLPISTVAQANTVISKIVNYSPANVQQSALLVADDPTGYYFNFELANTQVASLLPPSMTVNRVDRRLQPSTARANVIAKFNEGQALVNYSGHGNVDSWTSASIFLSNDAMQLSNGNRLGLVVVMDCLNGYFQEPNPTFSGLAEAFIQAPNGGAVASFASSGLTIPDGQHAMSTELYTLLYGSQPITLGDAIKASKFATTDIDVRRTWIFFGDPSMKIR